MQHHTQVTILQELMRQLDAGQNIDAGVQYRMPTKDYVCTDRAQQEQQHFFRDHPHVVGLSNDLPENGCFYTVDELGIPILTTRDQTGRFRAFLNACRHRSARVVSETRGKKSVLMCPFHHWSYSVSGELINVPNQDHFGDIDKACMGLVELPAEERTQLQACMAQLKQTDRLALVMYFDQKLSYAEIGRALGITENAVGPKLHRAQKRLRKLMKVRTGPT